MDENIIIIAVAPANNEHDHDDVHKPGCFKVLFSITVKFFKHIFQITRREPPQPSLLVAAAAAADEPTPPPSQARDPVRTICLHPITVMIREQELGKSIFNLGAPITIALLITTGGKSQTVLEHLVLTGLSAGCISIWNGMAFRGTFPRAANVIEQLGILTVLMSFNGLVASALPMEFAWVPILCGGLCLLPVVIAALPHQADDDH